MAENPFAIPPSLKAGITRVQNIALVIGIVFTALTLIEALIDPEQFFRSWMVGFLFIFALGVGGLAVLMLQYMTGGAWGMVARRQFEAASRTIPLVTLLFVPLFFGIHHLYEWANPEIVRHDAILREKTGYLNPEWWIIRSVIVFVCFNVLMFVLNRLSAREEATGDSETSRRMMGWSSVGTLVYVFALTSAGTDWLMSMDPKWFSTIYGLILLGSQGLTIFSAIIFCTTFLMKEEPLKSIVTKRHLLDLGKFLFMFTLFWTYVSFSQLVIIWAGNLPEEITWYVNRMNGSWIYVGAILLFLGWMLPFLILLSQDIKRSPNRIRMMCVWILLVRLADVIWQVEPNYHKEQFYVHWADFTAPLGLVGLWTFYFLMQLKKRALIPVNAPDLERGLVYGPAR